MFFFGGGINTDPTITGKKGCFPGKFLAENTLLGSVLNYYIEQYLETKFGSKAK
jgi:hypothetical protein